jgi:hypothetical protein
MEVPTIQDQNNFFRATASRRITTRKDHMALLQNSPCSHVAMFKTEHDRRTKIDGGVSTKKSRPGAIGGESTTEK